MPNQEDYQRVTIRIPPELHADLRRVSDASERSINAEIIKRLTDSIAEDDRKAVLQHGDPYMMIARTAQDITEMAQAILSANVVAATNADPDKTAIKKTPGITRNEAMASISESERELLELYNDISITKRSAVMSSMLSLHDALTEKK